MAVVFVAAFAGLQKWSEYTESFSLTRTCAVLMQRGCLQVGYSSADGSGPVKYWRSENRQFTAGPKN